MKVLPIASLVFNYEFYPRVSVDAQHVSYIAQAMLAGSQFPPIVVTAKSLEIIDGFHRAKAVLKVFGDNATIEVEERTYKNRKDMLMDAIRLNATHGRSLDRHDRVRCGLLAKEFGVPIDSVAATLQMASKRFRELLADRTATGPDNAPLVLKQTIRHMAGKKLTKSQVEANQKLGGMNQAFFVNQVIFLIENDLVDDKNEKLLGRMTQLREALKRFFDSRKEARKAKA